MRIFFNFFRLPEQVPVRIPQGPRQEARKGLPESMFEVQQSSA